MVVLASCGFALAHFLQLVTCLCEVLSTWPKLPGLSSLQGSVYVHVHNLLLGVTSFVARADCLLLSFSLLSICSTFCFYFGGSCCLQLVAIKLQPDCYAGEMCYLELASPGIVSENWVPLFSLSVSLLSLSVSVHVNNGSSNEHGMIIEGSWLRKVFQRSLPFEVVQC